MSWLKCYRGELWERFYQQLRIRVVFGRETAGWDLRLLQMLLLARGKCGWTLAVTVYREIDHYFYGTQRNKMYSKQIAVYSKNCDKSLLQ